MNQSSVTASKVMRLQTSKVNHGNDTLISQSMQLSDDEEDEVAANNPVNETSSISYLTKDNF